MKNTKQHPRAAGVIAAALGKFQESYAISATARWQKDGLWVEGTIGSKRFELLAGYDGDSENADIVVHHLATWLDRKVTP